MDDAEQIKSSVNVKTKHQLRMKEISPLGISRYGRTRKPKISLDFCSIDDAIDDTPENGEVKRTRSPTKFCSKTKFGQTGTNGILVPTKESIIKPRMTHINNNTEVLHVTGDSDINHENLSKSQRNSKPQARNINSSPVIRSLSVTKEKVLEIKDKQLTEKLKPILSEEIFQTPSIDVAEVLKIISNKSNDLELDTITKHNSKGTLKTYTNKRKSFQRPSSLIESFGLPDEPIVPINSGTFIKPLRISEIDVDVVKPESVNLIDRELIDSLWKIGSADEDYICHEESNIMKIPIFDIRSRFTPDEELLHKNEIISKNKVLLKDQWEPKIASPTMNKKYKSDACKTVDTINDSVQLLKDIVSEKKEVTVIKRIITKNDDDKRFERKESFMKTPRSIDAITTTIVKKDGIKKAEESNINIKLNSDLKLTISEPKKGICALVYERDSDNMTKIEKKVTEMDIGDIEEHIKISLIDKQNKEIVSDLDKEKLANTIDINKLKTQINSRIELMKSEEEEVEEAPITDTVSQQVNISQENCIVADVQVNSLFVDSPNNITSEEIHFALGDLLWAKIGNYPYWPCMITKDPQSKEYKKSKYRNITSYHVRFFGDNGRRSWISNKNLLPFNTDLDKVKEERKNEIIIPHENTKSYMQWIVGVAEADSLKEKGKKEKFDFFRKMFATRRLNKKIRKERVDKLSKRMKVISNKNIHKKIISPIGTEKLHKKVIDDIVDIDETKDFKRSTRSSLQRKNSIKLLNHSKDTIDEVDSRDVDSKKHDSSSQFSDEEINSKPFPLTIESQIALFKRNNLFKGVSKERVCQICEKPEGVIKCKGRCNGYYHMSCASRKIKSKDDSELTEMEVSILDNTFESEESQNTIIEEEDGNNVQQVVKDIEQRSLRSLRRSKNTDESPNVAIYKNSQIEKKHEFTEVIDTNNINGNCQSKQNIGLNSAMEHEVISSVQNEQNTKLEEPNGTINSKGRRRSRNLARNSDLFKQENRRITRSQSQEPVRYSEADSKNVIEIKEYGDQDLDEIQISPFLNTQIKIELDDDQETSQTSPCSIQSENKKIFDDNLKEEILNDKPIEVSENRRQTRSALNRSNDETKDKKIPSKEFNKANAYSEDANLTYKKPELIKNCNVKIVTVRKKSGALPKLALNKDPELEKLPLFEKIDQKMQEVMARIDKKPLYADSTTDYTSSEESAFDLSPKGKGLNCLHTSQVNKNTESNGSGSNKSDDADKKKAKVVRTSKNEQAQNEADFKCAECLEDVDHICFVCHSEVSRKGSAIRQKCSLFTCGKFYHSECLKVWPQTQWSVLSTTKHKQSNESLDTFVCPVHVCHTCVSDDPRAAIPRCTSDKVVKCLRCPATYHNGAYCIPAGTAIYSSTQIVCPRHWIPKRVKKKALPIINTTWCFICSEGGDLICCETCPTSVHSECLKINLTDDDTFICEDCETGRFPLYDEIVWVKLGHYRWWPGVILFPNEIPERIKMIKHNNGQFVVRFFGSHDHYWVGRGRVFLFQEGDSGEAVIASSRRKTDLLFRKSIEEATEAHRIKKEFKQAIIEEAAIKLKYKPPPYIKIKVNRPVGNVRQFDGNISNTTPCECDPKSENPCGADSDCLNRLLLTECNSEVCPAGEKCQNQNFEKRNYPPLVPYRTETRGWGLKSLEPLKKGEFVIEYVGEMIDEQEYQRRIKKMHEQKEENYYFLTIDKDRMLDAGPKGNVARFMNHSCQPNCETQKWTVNGDTRVGLFSVTDIPANTELTFNYNLECVGKEKKICKCGAPNCSGFIGLKAKQEESRKSSKSKLRHKRKKSPPILEPINKKPCFMCGEVGDVTSCNNKICTKSYHLHCVKLDTPPDNKWVCPWHNCNTCTKRTIRCCVKCINSYCPVHAEGNIRYDKLLGFICSEHDPIRAESQEIKLEDCVNKDNLSPNITEENDVTSTTSDEHERNVSQPAVERQMTPTKSMEHIEVLTSTPVKPENSQNSVDDVLTLAVDSKEAPLKRKRGRPRKDKCATPFNPKKIKLNNEGESESKVNAKKPYENHALIIAPPSVRELRTSRAVNYGGVSDKAILAQKKIESILPVRKRSSLRCE